MRLYCIDCLHYLRVVKCDLPDTAVIAAVLPPQIHISVPYRDKKNNNMTPYLVYQS